MTCWYLRKKGYVSFDFAIRNNGVEIIDITLNNCIQYYRFGKEPTENKALQYQIEVFRLFILKIMKDLLEKSKRRTNAV